MFIINSSCWLSLSVCYCRCLLFFVYFWVDFTWNSLVRWIIYCGEFCISMKQITWHFLKHGSFFSSIALCQDFVDIIYVYSTKHCIQRMIQQFLFLFQINSCQLTLTIHARFLVISFVHLSTVKNANENKHYRN